VYPVYKKNGIDVPQDVFASICETFWSSIYNDCGDGISPFEKRLISQFEFFEINVPLSKIEKLACEISEAWFAEHYLDAEAVDLLRYFKKRKKTALITNFDHPPFIRIMLERYKIDRYFDSVIISGEVGVKKPMPEIFNPALAETGLSYEDVVYVGDSIMDFRAALRAGILPIIIRREGQHDPSRPGNVESVYEKTDTQLYELFLKGQIEVVTRLSEVKGVVKKHS
jgi:HAD superfamily hydrolase (TIGR01549 family)